MKYINSLSISSIAKAEIFIVEADFVTPYKLSYGVTSKTRAVMLKLTDAEGLVGWGEANPTQPFTPESPEEAAEALKKIIIPEILKIQHPTAGLADKILDDLVPGHLCAKGAVSTALLDLLGKRLQVPVATLLGGCVHKSLPVLWPLGNGTAEDDIQVIDNQAAKGFTSFMLKMGAAPIKDELKRVEALEKKYGNSIRFIADANQGWSIEQSQEFLRGARGSKLVFVEQPVEKYDIEGMATLSRSTALPLSADESLQGLGEAAQIASRGAAKIFSIKSSKNGGPLRAQSVAMVAKAFGIRCYMNSMLEFGITQAASLQHAVTINNLVDFGHAFMSTLRLAEDPTNFSTFIREGIIYFPDEVGIGLQVDEDHVRRMAIASSLVR
ncbi:mandelate racemase [Acidovorax sp. D2M1]|uniref:Mandelate racemase n=1 Tax=Acidovorax benzenivorans TaxID=2987520 RepID=A0ABT5RZX4_9BURK|nr:enolase C-terminal domain-like protein [Acidovorax benzenivorans]MDD2179240.1 mandelate racemase [Acidovorax benzenivorans]